jgi:hypothetical protein
MSIFGIKKKPSGAVDALGLKQEIFNMRNQIFTHLRELNEKVNNNSLENTLINNKVDDISGNNVISICAESKGALQKNKVFSFGNGGKEKGVGYIMNFPGRILSMGLSSKRTDGRVSVVVSINGILFAEYYITLDIKQERKYYNFPTSLKVEAGDSIDFVCMNNNQSCENTVVSMIIEIFI